MVGAAATHSLGSPADESYSHELVRVPVRARMNRRRKVRHHQLHDAYQRSDPSHPLGSLGRWNIGTAAGACCHYQGDRQAVAVELQLSRQQQFRVRFDRRPRQGPQPGQPRLLTADNEMVVLVNKVMHVLVSGADVIHSWCRRSASASTPFRAASTTPGSGRRGKACITAGAPNCAASTIFHADRRADRQRAGIHRLGCPAETEICHRHTRAADHIGGGGHVSAMTNFRSDEGRPLTRDLQWMR